MAPSTGSQRQHLSSAAPRKSRMTTTAIPINQDMPGSFTLFTEGTAAHEECVSQGTKGTGPCYACGGPGIPAPTCGINQTLNTTTCQCEGPVCAAGSIPGTRCATCQYPGTTTTSCFWLPHADGNGTVCVAPPRPGEVSSCSDCAEGDLCLTHPSLCFGQEFLCFLCAPRARRMGDRATHHKLS
jgi:hypothetical protein